MHTTLSLPFGISLELTPHDASVTASRLEREFYVPTDDLGSKAESARIAFEELLCGLARAGFELDSPCRAPSHQERRTAHRIEALSGRLPEQAASVSDARCLF